MARFHSLTYISETIGVYTCVCVCFFSLKAAVWLFSLPSSFFPLLSPIVNTVCYGVVEGKTHPLLTNKRLQFLFIFFFAWHIFSPSNQLVKLARVCFLCVFDASKPCWFSVITSTWQRKIKDRDRKYPLCCYLVVIGVW